MTIQELARLANVGGNIRRQRMNRERRAKAEKLLSERTDQAKELSKKEMKGGKFLDAIKFGASFFGPTGQAVSAALSLVDAFATAKALDKFKSEFDTNIPKELKGTPYESILKSQIGGLEEQLEGALTSRKQANTLQELLTAGLKLGSAKIPVKEPTGYGFSVPSGSTTLFDRFLPKDKMSSKFLEKAIPGLGTGRTIASTSLGDTSSTVLDLGLFGKSFLEDLLDKDSTATSPEIPLAPIASTRRRIR